MEIRHGKYFLLQGSHREGDIFVREYEDPADFSEDYLDGNPYPTDSPPARLFYRSSRERNTDWLPGTSSIPIVAGRFRDVVTQYEPENLAFYPVELICRETSECDNSFYFMNILGNISCLDQDRSRFRRSAAAPQVILSIDELVLAESMINQRHLFRMKEFDILIFVTALLRHAMEHAELSGVRFVRLGEYHE